MTDRAVGNATRVMGGSTDVTATLEPAVGQGVPSPSPHQALQEIAEETERRRTLFVAAAGTLLTLMVYTTPLTVMPSIAKTTGAGSGTQTWLLAAVSLGMATTLISAGALGDDYGRKRVLVGG